MVWSSVVVCLLFPRALPACCCALRSLQRNHLKPQAVSCNRHCVYEALTQRQWYTNFVSGSCDKNNDSSIRNFSQKDWHCHTLERTHATAHSSFTRLYAFNLQREYMGRFECRKSIATEDDGVKLFCTLFKNNNKISKPAFINWPVLLLFYFFLFLPDHGNRIRETFVRFWCWDKNIYMSTTKNWTVAGWFQAKHCNNHAQRLRSRWSKNGTRQGRWFWFQLSLFLLLPARKRRRKRR